ncbi:MAG: PKD-like domain-containing protein [Chitinophagia bacterium]|jgi:gliding motility-associated-like protein
MRRLALLIILLSFIFSVNGQTSYNITTCSGIAFGFSEVTEPSGTTYKWSLPAGSDFSGGTEETVGKTQLTGLLSNSTNNFVTATYTITSSTANSYTLVVSIAPVPKVNAIPDQTEVCPIFFGTPLISLSGPTPNTRYFWNYDGVSIGLPFSGNNTTEIPTYTARNETNSLLEPLINVIPTINGCQGIPTSFRMRVKPAPNVGVPPDVYLCHGIASSQINFTSSIPNSTITWTNNKPSIGLASSGNTFIPAFIPNYTGFVPTTAIISVSGFSNGCSGESKSFQIVVIPIPQMNAVSSFTICGNVNPPVTFQAPFYPTSTEFIWSNNNISNGLPSAGRGQLNIYTANNFSNMPVTGIITVKPSLFGCEGSSFTFTATIRPTPKVDNLINIETCNNTTVGPFNFSGSAIEGTVYNWQHSSPGIGLASTTGSGSIPAFSATNVGNLPVVATFSVQPFTSTCTGPTMNFTIRVNPSPTVAQISDKTACEFQNSGAINFTGNVSGTIFNWTNDNPAIGLTTSGVGNISSFTYTNPIIPDITGRVVVTPVSNACSGTPMSFSFTVKAAPELDVVSSLVRCSGSWVDPIIFATPTMPGSIITWTRTPIQIGQLPNDVPLSGTQTVNGFTTVNYSLTPYQSTFTVTPFSNTCYGPVKTFTYTVNPTPTVVISPSLPIDICSGLTTTITFSGSALLNTQYEWSSGSNLIGIGFSGIGSIGTFVTSNPSASPIYTNIQVKPVANGCAGVTQSLSITVKPTPGIFTPPNLVRCAGTSISPITFTGSIVEGTQYNWTNSNTNIGLSSISGTGTINSFTATNNFFVPISSIVNVTAFSNGCSTSTSFNIRVNPVPTINPITDNVNCNGTAITIPFVGSQIAKTDYVWSNDNPGIGTTTSGVGNALSFISNSSSQIPITGKITVTPISNSCSGIPTIFSIVVNPIPSVNSIPDQVICNGSLTNQVIFSGSILNNTIYNWTNSNVAIGLAALTGTGNIAAFTTNNNGFYLPVASIITVTPISNTCSGTPISFSIIVNPTPTVQSFSDVSYCEGTNITLSFSGSAVPGTIYQWNNSRTDIGLSSSGSASSFTFTAVNTINTPISARITVTPVSNSCSGVSKSFSITIHPLPEVMTVSSKKVCSNVQLATINLTGSSVAGTQYNWNRTNVPIGSIPISGVGDINSFTGVNLSNAPITSLFTITPSTANCSGIPVNFSITINPLPSIAPIAGLTLCGNQPTGIIQFTDPTIGGTQFEWTNNNPSIGLAASGIGSIASFTITNNFTIPISAFITVKPVTNSCYGPSTQFELKVKPTPTVQQIDNITICKGVIVPKIIFSGSPIGNTTYNWTNSNPIIGIASTTGIGDIDTFTSTNSSNIPISTVIQVTPFSNDCTGSTMQFTIRVNPIPSVATIPSQIICASQRVLPISFTGTTNNGNVVVDGTIFNWTNNNDAIGLRATGIGNISSFTANYITNYSSTALITVTPAANNCTGSPQQFTLTVRPTPGILPVPDQIFCAGQVTNAITFTGSTIPNTRYDWYASNNLTGISAFSGTASINAFTSVNISNVMLSNTITVSAFSNGCSSNPINFQYNVYPIPSITPINQIIVCDGQQVSTIVFNSSPVAGTKYRWTNTNSVIGIPASGEGNIIAFTAINKSTTPIISSITVTPVTNNCSGTSISFTIIVKPNPIMITLLPQVICAGSITEPLRFVSSLPNTQFNWTNSEPLIGLPFTSGIGDIQSFTGTNQTALPITSLFTIQPVANGCIGPVQIVPITVNPIPILTSPLLPDGICNGSIFSYTATSATPGTSYAWERAAISNINSNASSSGFVSSISETLLNANPTVFTVSYSIKLTANGCVNSQTVSVLITPAASLTSPLSPAAICSGTLFSYTIQTATPGAGLTWRRNQIPGIKNPVNIGLANISELLENTTFSPVNVDYQVTLVSGGCVRSQTVTTVVLPVPNLSAKVLTTCSGIVLQYTPTNTVENLIMTWLQPTTSSAGSILGGSAGTSTSNSGTFVQSLYNTTTQTTSAIYSIQTRTTSCIGNTFTLTVQVLPVPIFNDVTINPVCSGTQFSYIHPASLPDTRFDWTLPIQVPKNSIDGARPASNQQQFFQTLYTLNKIQDTVIYTVQPITSNCYSKSFSLVVFVKPVPVFSNISTTICSGSRYTFSPDSIPAGTTLTWDIPEIFPLGSVGGTKSQNIPASTFSQTPVNLTNSAAIIKYKVFASTSGCSSPPFQIEATVTRPIQNFAALRRETCSGVKVDLTPTNLPTGMSFTWNPSINSANSMISGMTGSNISLSKIEQQLYLKSVKIDTSLLLNNNFQLKRDSIAFTILPYLDNCVGNPFTAVAVLIPLPQITINTIEALCQNINDTLKTFLAGTGPWQYKFDDNGIPGVRTSINSSISNLVLPPNNYRINPRITKFFQIQDAYCTNTEDTIVVTQKMYRLPVGKIQSLHGNFICNNKLDTLIALSADSIISLQWLKNGFPISGQIRDSLFTNEAGTYQLVFTNQLGCSDTAIAAHKLIASRVPVVKFKYDLSCINTVIKFFNQTDSLVTGPVTWKWDFGNGLTSNTYHAQTTYSVSGSYHVLLSAKQQNCDAFLPVTLDSVIQIVRPIEREDLPSMSAYKNIGKPIVARNLPGYKYNWSPSYGLRRTDSSSTIFNYGTSVKYGISMTSPEGCVTTDSIQVRVFNEQLVDIFVPKTFTPNGDGINDKIFAYTSGISKFNYLKIINRFGKQVFETRNVDVGWDGFFNGAQQPMSIYYWIAEGISEDGLTIQRSGQFLLMR